MESYFQQRNWPGEKISNLQNSAHTHFVFNSLHINDSSSSTGVYHNPSAPLFACACGETVFELENDKWVRKCKGGNLLLAGGML